MADPKQLALLLQNHVTLTCWRDRHPQAPLDLSYADLSTQDLICINLSGANLRGTNFEGAKLQYARFQDADLSEANFENADLKDTTFAGCRLHQTCFLAADLTRADFRGADARQAWFGSALLRGADFRGVCLRGATLGAADLRDADFTQADLTNVNMVYSRLGGTTFGDVDLRTVEGLESIDHRGRSTLGLDSFARSQGEIPLVFLRGCGLTDDFIAALFAGMERPIPPLINTASGARTPQGGSLPGLSTFREERAQRSAKNSTTRRSKSRTKSESENPEKRYDRPAYFISCHLQDTDFAERLKAALQEQGIRCWVDEHLLPAGYRHLCFRAKSRPSSYFSIDDPGPALRTRDKVLLCLSGFWLNGLDNEVLRELQEAQTRETMLNQDMGRRKKGRAQVLFALTLDSSHVHWSGPAANDVRNRMIADFRGWRDDNAAFELGLTQLLAALRSQESEERSA